MNECYPIAAQAYAMAVWRLLIEEFVTTPVLPPHLKRQIMFQMKAASFFGALYRAKMESSVKQALVYGIEI